MGRSIQAVVAFLEGPDVQGSRVWPRDTLVEVLKENRGRLPDLGIAPAAMLLSALDRGTTDRAGDGDVSTVTRSLGQWLSVSGHGRGQVDDGRRGPAPHEARHTLVPVPTCNAGSQHAHHPIREGVRRTHSCLRRRSGKSFGRSGIAQ